MFGLGSNKPPRSARKLSKQASKLAKKEEKQKKREDRLASLPLPLQAGILLPLFVGAALGFWASSYVTEMFPVQLFAALLFGALASYAYWFLVISPVLPEYEATQEELAEVQSDEEEFDPEEEARAMLEALEVKEKEHAELIDELEDSLGKSPSSTSASKSKLKVNGRTVDRQSAATSSIPSTSSTSTGNESVEVASYDEDDLRQVMLDVINRYEVDDVNAIEPVQSALGMVKFKCVVHTEANEYRVYRLTGNLDTGKGYLEVVSDGSQEDPENLLRVRIASPQAS